MYRITVPRYLVIIFTIVAGLWLTERTFQLIYRIADILLIFGLAWLLKLLVEPLIRRLQGLHMPRGFSIAVAYILVLGSLVSGLIWLIPQLSGLTQNLPQLTREVAQQAETAALWLQQRGIYIDPYAITSQIVGAGTSLASIFAQQAFYLAQSFLGVVGRIVLVITISVYMSLTSGGFSSVVRPVVPPRWRNEFDAFMRDIDMTYSSYISGYFYVVAIGTVLNGAILFSFQVPNAALWTLFILLLRLLPFVGGALANTLLIGVLFVSLPLGTAVLGAVLALVGQLLLTHALMPRIMSRTLGINPLLVLFAVLLGGRIYGVAGILFAIPAAAVIATVVGRAIDRYLLPLYRTKGWWNDQVTVLEQADEPVELPVAPQTPPAAPPPATAGAAQVVRGGSPGAPELPTRKVS